jgi:hypothetical protein
MRNYAPKYPTIKRQKITDGHLMVVDPADIHIGKLSLPEETNEEYNIKIARERCVEGVNGLLNKVGNFPLEKIVLVIGNDILHIDHPHRKTTSGTPQDTDTMWWKAFKEAHAMYVEIVEYLATIADVEVVYNASNHDFQSGFMLAHSLASWFNLSKNVHFDIDIIHRKYLQYGSNLIATSHGDGAKELDTPILMAQEAPEMWATTKYRYIYLHHVHHKSRIKWRDGRDYIGVSVEYLRSPSPADGWHHRNGFISMKAVEGFIHHKQQGQVARITHYF